METKGFIQHDHITDAGTMDNVYMSRSVFNCNGDRFNHTTFLLLIVLLNIFFVNFQYSGSNFYYDLQMPFVASSFSLTLTFVYFYLGQQFHTQTMALSDEIYEVKWYQYPCSIQRFVPLMIQRSQRPFYLSAYGITTLNLENFVGVSRMTA